MLLEILTLVVASQCGIGFAAAENVKVCLIDTVCADIPAEMASNFESRLNACFYNGSTAEQHTVIPLPKILEMLDHPCFNLDKPTVLYMHGFTETRRSKSVFTVLEGYLSRGDHNVVVLDWSEVCNRTYREAAALVPLAARAVAAAVDRLAGAGLPLGRLHLVGHSLGAQCAGHVGKFVTAGRLPRITALDPARPFFEDVGASHLEAGDAAMVDVIHTDGGVYGVLGAVGTVDFYPNGGTRYQPGCAACAEPLSSGDFCSHHASWKLYAHSLVDEAAYPAAACPCWLHFTMGLCRPNMLAPVYMGYGASPRAQGLFFLRADPERPLPPQPPPLLPLGS